MAEVLLETDTYDVHIDPPESLDVEIGDPMDKGSVISITKNGKHVVNGYDLAEVDVQPLPLQTKEVTITENGTTEVTPDEGRLLDKVVVKADTTESVILDFLNNGGTFAYYSGTTIPKIDYSRLNKPNYDNFFYKSVVSWDDIQNLINKYDDSKSQKDTMIFFNGFNINDRIEEVTLTIPKGFKNTKNQTCLPTNIGTEHKLKLITIDCNDLENTGTLFGWSYYFTLRLLNTNHLKTLYTPTSEVSMERFYAGAMTQLPLSIAYNRAANFGGFIDLGKGLLPNGSASHHTMLFDTNTKVTRESLLNILNDLYDLNLLDHTFTNPPTIKLGTKAYRIVTEDDIKIATDKGWTVIQ